MRIAAALVIAALPVLAAAQDKKPQGPSAEEAEITGCVKGSTFTDIATRRWRLRGPKAVMRDLKKHHREQVRIVGITKEPASGFGSTRIGRSNIYIGGNTNTAGRDPLPEPPTIDVKSFEVTGERCR